MFVLPGAPAAAVPAAAVFTAVPLLAAGPALVFVATEPLVAEPLLAAGPALVFVGARGLLAAAASSFGCTASTLASAPKASVGVLAKRQALTSKQQDTAVNVRRFERSEVLCSIRPCTDRMRQLPSRARHRLAHLVKI
jgi:hypothetical protein